MSSKCTDIQTSSQYIYKERFNKSRIRFNIFCNPTLLLLLNVASLTLVTGFGVKPLATPRSMDSLVLGTVTLTKDRCDPHQLLNDAYQRGFCRFDLARTYGGGEVEKAFGKWLDENSRIFGGPDRDEIKIVTKGGMGKDKYGDENRPKCTRASLRSELLASLDSLRTDYVDMYMFHRDDPRINACTFCDWMNEFIDEGLVKNWGVSNWAFGRVLHACEHAKETSQHAPKATSPQLSLAVPKGKIWPTTESLSCPSKEDEFKWYGKNNIEVMGWESLAKGFMAVPNLWNEDELDYDFLHGPDAETGTDAWRLQRMQRAYCTPENYERRKIAIQLAKESGLTLAQITLLYNLARGDHVSVLVGTNKVKHLDEFASIRHFELDKEAVACLSAASKEPIMV